MDELITVVFSLIATLAAVGPMAIAAYYDQKEKASTGREVDCRIH
jgi:hypothetical protein